MSIKNVFFVLTPFHKKVMMQLFPSEINNSNTLIFISKHVDSEGFKSEIIYLEDFAFSKLKLYKNPISYFYKVKNDIRLIKRRIKDIYNKYNFNQNLKIYSGNDKDIFIQLFVDFFYKKSSRTELIMVDEGLGFYVKKTFKDHVISIIYNILSLILFNSKIYFIKKLGSHPKVNTIYIRHVKLLRQISKNITYIEFKLNKVLPERLNLNNTILLYSFPDQDFNLKTNKITIIKQIANYLDKNNKKLVIKPHPRENYKELENALLGFKNVKILKANFTGEHLNYFDYELIINFFSSILLDLLDNNYPEDQIITIGITEKPLLIFDKLKYIFIEKFKISNDLIFKIK